MPVAAPPAAADAPTLSEQTAFAEDVTKRTFAYFWETTDTQRCLAPDRWPSNPFSSIAATGFALNAYGIGAERGYVSREDAAQRTLDCLEFYWNAPQGPAAEGVSGHKGFFYHFLKNEDGTRFGNTELSTVDTALLMGGVLFSQSYFDRDNPTEAAIRDLAEKRLREIAEMQAQVYGCSATVTYERGYPPTVNHAEQTRFAAQVAREVVGPENVRDDIDPIMPAEDFSYMLEARPGAYLFLGQGDTPNCHHPQYDFNDAIAPIGASFFARLVETALPLKS